MTLKGTALVVAAFVLASASAALAQSYRSHGYNQAYDSHYMRGSSSWDGASRGSFGGY